MDFVYEITKALGTSFTVHVVKGKDSDSIKVQFVLKVDEKTKKEINKKIKKKMSPLSSEINHINLMKGTSFAFVPDPEKMQQIIIFSEIFASELTKTSLFDAIRKAKDAGILTLLAINKYVETDEVGKSAGTVTSGVG